MDNIVFNGLLLAALCSLMSLFTHLIICSFRKGRSKNIPLIFELKSQAKLLLAIWFSSFLIYTLLFFFSVDKISILFNGFHEISWEFGFIYGMILYFILSFLYLSVYYLVDRSVSGTILEIVERSPEKRLTVEEIKKIYSIEKKYQSELKGMLEGRFIIKELDYYRNSLKGNLYARTAKLIKGLLKLGPGG